MTRFRMLTIFLLPALLAALPMYEARAAGDALDDAVLAVLQTKCVKCHDDRKAAAGAGVDNLLKLDELADGYVDADDPQASYLLDLTTGDAPDMPKKRMKDVQWNGALSKSELASLEKWIRRGGPSKAYLAAKAGKARELITEQQIVDAIAADLNALTGAGLKNARYLTLSNLHNNRGVADEELDVYRAAIVKTLNSLSRTADVLGTDTSSAVNKLAAVDEARTIFRFDLRHVGWSSHEWDRVAKHYPYALLQRRGAGRAVYSLTSSELPHLRADWFVFAVLQPPLYHELAGIPDTLDKLEKSLGVDRIQAIRDRKVARAGMESSRVSVNNRLLERIPMTTRAGAYHISYDFASNDGVQNFFDNPLGPEGAFNTRRSFKHDGGEVIFNLPNGFQAYALVAAAGDRLDIAPQAIVQDQTMPGSVIINGISCLSCHYQGMKPETGTPRLSTLDNVRASALDDFARFTAGERELIGELYPKHETFTALLEQDRQRFLNAMQAAGIEQQGSDEPARALFDRFVNDLDLDAVAAEFGLTPEDLARRMQRESETRTLLRRIERGTLKRQLFLTEFKQIANLTGAGEPRRFEELPFPYFGEKVEQAAAANPGHEKEDAGKPLALGRTGVDLLDAEHRTGALKVEIWTADNRKSYTEDEAITCRVRATEDCFLTIVSVDAAGDVTLLLPNKWHPEFKLKAGRTITMPSKEMGFEFYATEPHGQTILKAIATKEPLKLKGVDRGTLREKGLVALGNAKAIGVRKRRDDAASHPENQGSHVSLTDKKLEETFRPNQWATATWTLATRKK